ncbi:hypothetical protein EVAR_95055_1 [Eumeta japonica]|uniref:Uncharacterized protein n=1 Tax=Eumeta variegata TaxID=151549 RepID=A0A4C1W6F1_EUMVA|nr:hypothetical protein EVAR_95055_1 [Eumeta japonica]
MVKVHLKTNPTRPNIARISGGARRRRRRRPPTASRLKGPRKQKSFAYKLLKRGLPKSFAYKLFKRGLANLMSPTSTSGVAPLLARIPCVIIWNSSAKLPAHRQNSEGQS